MINTVSHGYNVGVRTYFSVLFGNYQLKEIRQTKLGDGC